MTNSLKGKKIVLTDALHFVGPGTVPSFLAQGVELLVQDDQFQDTEKRTEFEQAFPAAMVARARTVGDLAAEALDRLGSVDVLINNDAFPAKKLPIEEATADDLRDALERLVIRGFTLAGQLVPSMKDQGFGKIIFVTSAAPLGGVPNYTVYAASRAAANGLVKSLALELAPANIQVNAVAPNFLNNPDYYPDELMARPELAEKILRQIPLNRLGTQEEMAALMSYLAGDESGFITGQVIPFAGGWI